MGITTGRDAVSTEAPAPPAGTAAAVRPSRFADACQSLSAHPVLVYGSALAALALALYLAGHKYEVDIAVYLMGGHHALGPSLYTVDIPNRPFLVFTYPPFAALVFWPLAHVAALRQAQLLWAVVNVVALYGLLTISIRAVRPDLRRPQIRRWALLGMLPAVLLNPVFLTVGLGQVDLILCWAVMADFFGSRRIGRFTVPFGVAIGLAGAVKLTPLIFIPYLVLTGRRRGAVTATVTFLVVTAASAAVTPRASWTYFSRDIHLGQRAGALLDLSDQNLHSALSRFVHGPVPGTVLWPLSVAVAIGGLAVAAWAYARSSEILGVLVAADTALLVSPITWTHHMVWIVPSLLWLTLARDAPRFGAWIALGLALLFWLPPTWAVPTSWWPHPHPIELREHGWQMVAGNTFFLLAALSLVGVTALLWHRYRRPTLGDLQHAWRGDPLIPTR